MTRWTKVEEVNLSEMAAERPSAAICARILGRTASAVYGKASALSVSFTRAGASAELALWNAIPLVRDQVGDLVSWSPASRSGSFYAHAPACERLLSAGMLKCIHGSTYMGA